MRRALILSAILAFAIPAAAQNQDPKKPQDPKGGVGGGPAVFPPFKVDQMKVDKAIREGIKYLQSNNAAHMARFDHVKRQMQHAELVLWTYCHAGVPDNDPNFQTLFKDMMERKLEATYCVSLQAMVLEEIQRVKYQQRIWQCAQFLVDNQSAEGFWGYGDPSIYVEDVPTTAPTRADVSSGGAVKKAGSKELDPLLPPGMRYKPPIKNRMKVEKKRDGNPNDQSNSQYAALGLRACHDGGIDLPAAVIEKAMAYFRGSQKASEGPAMKLEFKDANGKAVQGGAARGASAVMEEVSAEPQGWCYGKHEHKPYGSMSAGAVGTLAMFDYIKDNDGGKKKSWRKDKDVHEGIAWLAKNFSVTYNPGPYEHANFAENGQVQYFYYLYALERAGMLYGTETIGTHEWYPEGAKVLCDIQKANGSWGGGTVDTCFAILFLKRATRPLDVATGGGK
ncbi:MAG TPA: hypothetical protein VJB14_17420 [Planctomycetota bacterium]|nr:hypothetical protein [Planctomycetota bacterium]